MSRIVLLFFILFILVILIIPIILFPYKQNIATKEFTINLPKYTIDARDRKRVIPKLREMHPKDFEEFIALLFELTGYNITYSSERKKKFGKWHATKDGGIDLICEKGEKKNYIQIKKLINQEISVKIVREMWGVCADQMQGNNTCMIITTSLFSKDSLLFAKEKGITLIDYRKLLSIIDDIASSDPEKKTKIEDFINSPDLISNGKFVAYTKTCPLCLAPLVKRKRGGFYGCMNYYRTKCGYTEQPDF